MAAKIKTELAVGITEEIKNALEIATDFCGMKPSQYGRQAIVEKLVREGFLEHPGMVRRGNLAPQNEIKPALAAE
jgi:hypothetical protein